MELPTTLSEALDRITAAVQDDGRFVGLAVGGSVLTGTADDSSDLDLVLVVEDDHYDQVMAERLELAAEWGDLLAAFTGEHVGEPRLVITVYAPLVHVDLKFVRLSGLSPRIEDPAVIWEREGRVSAAIAASTATPLTVDPQWVEDRFWTWIHYAASKLDRGELFEVIDCLAFLRATALVPLECVRQGIEPRGVRRVEFFAPALAQQLAATVPTYDRQSCAAALERCVDLYLSLRDRLPNPPIYRERMTELARNHLRSVLT